MRKKGKKEMKASYFSVRATRGSNFKVRHFCFCSIGMQFQ